MHWKRVLIPGISNFCIDFIYPQGDNQFNRLILLYDKNSMLFLGCYHLVLFL